jgi:hypothetical protein
MWSTPVDLYCERTDPSFWAEPINAWTNAAFLIAAAAAFVQWQRRKGRDLPVLALITVTAAVGIGSFVFHTIATRGAALLDTIPIAVFIYGYLLLALRRFLRVGLIAAGAILAAFAAGSHGLAWVVPRGFLNGSYAYLPALVALLAVGFLIQEELPRRMIFLAAGVFSLSLVLRTIDLWICSVFPLGTHFVWHILNGVVLYLLLDAAMKPHERAAHIEPYSQAMPS